MKRFVVILRQLDGLEVSAMLKAEGREECIAKVTTVANRIINMGANTTNVVDGDKMVEVKIITKGFEVISVKEWNETRRHRAVWGGKLYAILEVSTEYAVSGRINLNGYSSAKSVFNATIGYVGDDIVVFIKQRNQQPKSKYIKKIECLCCEDYFHPSELIETFEGLACAECARIYYSKCKVCGVLEDYHDMEYDEKEDSYTCSKCNRL